MAKLFSQAVSIVVPALIAGVLSYGLVAGCGSRPAPSVVPSVVPVDPADPEPVSAEQAELLRLHNAARASAGLSPLVIDDACQRAAEKHAAWMASRRRMSHAGAGGSSFWERLKDEGYRGRSGGENIAVGYATPASVFRGWMGSAGHRRNIHGASWQHVGFGVASDSNGRRYWCAVFAAPAEGFETGPWIVEIHDGENDETLALLPGDSVALWLPKGVDADAEGGE